MTSSKLEQGEKQDNQKLEYFKLMSSRNLEDQIAKFRKESDIRFKHQLEAEVLRLRETEINEMRLQEAQVFAEKLAAERLKLDAEFKNKQEKLADRERKVLEACKLEVRGWGGGLPLFIALIQARRRSARLRRWIKKINIECATPRI